MKKHIFVMGGVMSSLGKGITSSSIALLLKRMGYSVGMQKMDPYLNVDPGTMSPYQHGEVFVTDDGAQTDLDLGHYQRFIDQPMSRLSSVSSGQIYKTVLEKERRGDYLGKTVQVIPHVTDEIKNRIKKMSKEYDIVITEIGGTVGDMQSLPFLEAIRQFRMDVGVENSLFVYLTYIPYLKSSGELKTKPTQHSVIKLREIGIQPDILVCRSDNNFDDELKKKISLYTNVSQDSIIKGNNVKNIFSVPISYYQQKMHEIICKKLNIQTKNVNLEQLRRLIFMTNSLQSTKIKPLKVAICGKYTQVVDSYKSIYQSIMHASWEHSLPIQIVMVDTQNITDINISLKEINAIIIPGGFGNRGIDGKIEIVKYARINNIPLLGICLGMQIMTIQYAKNVCNLYDAYSSQFDSSCVNPVIHLMQEQQYIDKMGGTMRLGSYPCRIKEDTIAHKTYGQKNIDERHRHRYQFNNQYRKILQSNGLVISGTSPDGMLVEIIQCPINDFFIGVQFHPQFKSRPLRAHPLFSKLIQAAKNRKNN